MPDRPTCRTPGCRNPVRYWRDGTCAACHVPREDEMDLHEAGVELQERGDAIEEAVDNERERRDW